MEIQNRERVWSVKHDAADEARIRAINEISDKLSISNICAVLLYNRGRPILRRSTEIPVSCPSVQQWT